MISRKLYCSVALAGALALSLTSSALAQGPVDQRTYFTFSAPIELPGGKTLPAGKYTFRVMDSPSNRHVVQVMSQDGRQMHATLLAIPAQRQDPPSDPEIRFMEAAANTPPAIRTWWYPGRTIGHEFIYPKDQARRLAARQAEPVLTVTGDERSTDDMQKAELARVAPSGDETAIADAAPRAADRVPDPRPVTTTADATREPRTELSRTASPLPLIGITGVLALMLAGALRLRRA
jgi:hypothetical protein